MKALARALLRAGAVGAASGLRSQWGPAAVALTTAPRTATRPAVLLAPPWVKALTVVAAAGEFVADKSPVVPGRLSAAGFLPRLASGALAAAALTSRRPAAAPALTGASAVVGAALAGAAASAGHRWRTAGPVRPDAVAAAAEDLLALTLACAACTPRRARAGAPGPEGPDEPAEPGAR